MKQFVSICFLVLAIITAKAATVDTINVYSAAMHKNIRCVVIKPKNYYTYPNYYPVVYLLHGWSGNYAQWIKLAPQLKNAVEEFPMLIVCPDAGYDSWYFDSPVDTSVKYETFVAKELTLYVDQKYKTMADRSKRAITGLSMGGHGALYLAIKHPDIFGAAGSMSGGLDLRPFPDKWGISKDLGEETDHAENWAQNSVVNLVEKLKNDQVWIQFDCGTSDFFIDVNRATHKKLLELKINHDYTERPGEHNDDYWRSAVDVQLFNFRKFFERKAPS